MKSSEIVKNCYQNGETVYFYHCDDPNILYKSTCQGDIVHVSWRSPTIGTEYDMKYDLDDAINYFDKNVWIVTKIEFKEKVKNWRVVYENILGNLIVSFNFYRDKEEFEFLNPDLKFVQIVDSTMIEVEENA